MSFKIADKQDEDLARLNARREAARVKIWEKAKPDDFLAAPVGADEAKAFAWAVFPSGPTLRDLAEARFLIAAMGQARAKGLAKDTTGALKVVLKSASWAEFQSDLNTLKAWWTRCSPVASCSQCDGFSSDRATIKKAADFVRNRSWLDGE